MYSAIIFLVEWKRKNEEIFEISLCIINIWSHTILVVSICMFLWHRLISFSWSVCLSFPNVMKFPGGHLNVVLLFIFYSLPVVLNIFLLCLQMLFDEYLGYNKYLIISLFILRCQTRFISILHSRYLCDKQGKHFLLLLITVWFL